VIDQRRRIFVGLLAAGGATLVLGLVPALRMLLEVHLALDVLLAGYVVYLVRTKPQPRRQVLGATAPYRVPERREERPYLRVGQL
jgi:hypothetical protein